MTFLEFLDFSNIHFIISLFISLANAVLLVLVAKKFFQILQISGYKIKGYAVWLKDTKAKYISRVAMLSFLSLAAVLVTNFVFDGLGNENFWSYLGLVFYIYFTIVFVVGASKSPQKTPLVQTRRMSRLMTLLFILGFVLTFMLIWIASVWFDFLRYGIIVLTPLFVPVLVVLVHFMLVPLEGLIRISYINKAKRKLKRFPDLIKIGLTGSWGKTSVKYILNKMLDKFNVCITPHSFNTPMGVTKVVLKYLKKEHNLLIVEMGAKAVGDIRYLCNIVQPDHAVITAVGTQHYETFGSEENVAKAKFELVEALPSADEEKWAKCVFNGEDAGALALYEKTPENRRLRTGKGGVVWAEDIEILPNGTKFLLCTKEEKWPCFTALLGRHNVENICVAAAMAIELGVDVAEIVETIKELEQTQHRLESSTNGNVTILDDAYSANEAGAKCALEVLGAFKDHVKICVTPGIVEMGAREKDVNKKFGEEIAGVADWAIIVNKVNQEAIREGLLAGGFSEDKIVLAEDLEFAKKEIEVITKSRDKFVILFENDLPDNYT